MLARLGKGGNAGTLADSSTPCDHLCSTVLSLGWLHVSLSRTRRCRHSAMYSEDGFWISVQGVFCTATTSYYIDIYIPLSTYRTLPDLLVDIPYCTTKFSRSALGVESNQSFAAGTKPHQSSLASSHHFNVQKPTYTDVYYTDNANPRYCTS